jgi:hypothetical protein
MQYIDPFVTAVNQFYNDTECKEIKNSKIPIEGKICRPIYPDAMDKPKFFSLPYRTGSDRFQPYGNELARLLIERHFDVPDMEVWLGSSYYIDGYEVDINSIRGTINGFTFHINYSLAQHQRGYDRYNSSGYSEFCVNGIELITSNCYDQGVYNPTIYVYDGSSLIKTMSSDFDTTYDLKAYCAEKKIPSVSFKDSQYYHVYHEYEKEREKYRYFTTKEKKYPGIISGNDYVSLLLTGRPVPPGTNVRLSRDELNSVIADPTKLKQIFEPKKIGTLFQDGPINIEFMVSDTYDVFEPYFKQIIDHVKSFPPKNSPIDFSKLEIKIIT